MTCICSQSTVLEVAIKLTYGVKLIILMNALGEIKLWKSGVTCEKAIGMRLYMAGQYKCLPSMHKALTFNP